MKVRVRRRFAWTFPGAPVTVFFNVGQIWDVAAITDTSFEIHRQSVELTVSKFAIEECFEGVDDE